MKDMFLVFLFIICVVIIAAGYWVFGMVRPQEKSLQGANAESRSSRAAAQSTTKADRPAPRKDGDGPTSHKSVRPSHERTSFGDEASKLLKTETASNVGVHTARTGYVVYVCPYQKYCWAILVNEGTTPPYLWEGEIPARSAVERKLRETSSFLTWGAFPLSESEKLDRYMRSRRQAKISGTILKLEYGLMVMRDCRIENE